MKKSTSLLAISTLLLFAGCTNDSSATPKSSKAYFQTVSSKQAILTQKGTHKESCIVCGMNLTKYYKTSHAAVTKSGENRQYCSIHCVVEDNEINKTDLQNLKVVDTNTLKLISVYKAFYVVGSSKAGTMSRTSKYAFSTKSQADAFAKKFGGKVMNFNDTYTVAMKDFRR